MEAKYEEYLEFADTVPLNNKFEFFGTDNKIFTSNTGSLYAVIALIYADALFRYIINYICMRWPHKKYPRAVGVHFYVYDGSTKSAITRIMLEGYFDIAFCAMLNTLGYYDQRDDWSKLVAFFDTWDDFINSMITIAGFFFTFIFPVWVGWKLHKNFGRLHKPEVQDQCGVFIEGYNYNKYHSAMYNFYFMVRRAVTLSIIMLMWQYPLYQLQLLIISASANIIYFMNVQPFDSL